MKVVIVEDKKEINNKINKLTNRILIEKNYDSDVISFLGYNEELKKILYSPERKIYILDIILNDYSGHDIAREIREKAKDWDSIIIISSAHNLKETLISERLSIFTYLLKEKNFEEELKETIESALSILELKGVLTPNKEYKLIHDDIFYVKREKNSKYCNIHTLKDIIRVRKSLKSIQQELKLKKIKKYLLVNEKNINFLKEEEIIFKNEEVLKLN